MHLALLGFAGYDYFVACRGQLGHQALQLGGPQTAQGRFSGDSALVAVRTGVTVVSHRSVCRSPNSP